MRVHAKSRKGKFGHIRAANQNKASLTQARNNGGIFFSRRAIGKQNRASFGHIASYIKQILY